MKELYKKKLYLGLKLKGKGRLCCLYFKKIAVCNNYLLADSETKRLKNTINVDLIEKENF